MPKGYHHLTKEQRCQLSLLKGRGESFSQIARALNVHPTTVYREFKRNRYFEDYDHEEADELAKARRSQAHRGPMKMTEEVTLWIEKKIQEGWSPEQIAGRMKYEKCSTTLSHETIYQHVWKDKRAGGALYRHLRHHGKKYNKRGKGKAGRGCIPHRVGIEQRPSIVEEKTRRGDWEVDTVIGSGHSGALVSMVDRMTKKVRLAKVNRCTAKEVGEALVRCLRKERVRTATSDNGKEFSGHQEISRLLGAEFYFADPCHSWQRGLNEHTNGLVRQYYKKKQRFDQVSQVDLLAMEVKLNNRPRKALGYQTPLEVERHLATADPPI